MPLIENIKTVIGKYDLKSYSPVCNTYALLTEEKIFFMLINEKERGNKSVKEIAEELHDKGKKHSSVRGSYVGESLLEFDKFLKRYFKLK
jgi:hypothetical protein